MRLALLQLNPRVGDLAANAAKLLRGWESARAQKADLAISGELALSGYPPKDLLFNQSFLTKIQATLVDLAQQTASGLPWLVGAPLQEGGKLFNAAFLLGQGKIQQKFKKRLLPNYDVFDERRYFVPGRDGQVFTLKGTRIGVTICEDIWNDSPQIQPTVYEENPVAELRGQGVDLLINLSASPFFIGKHQARRTMLSTVARGLGKPLIYVNQVGGNDDLIFDGRSLVFSGQGELWYEAKGFAEAIACFDLKPSPPIEVKARAVEEEIYEALVLGTRDYLRKCGFKKALLGLSGGIDSALVAVLATRALGAEQVTALLMPSPYSSPGSVADSLELAQRLKIQAITLSIEPTMRGYAEVLKGALPGFAGTLTEENLQARIRGNLLMAYSNQAGAMLLTTGNKSELSVGYCTIYGDMAGGLAVISDLPKTKVYDLCRWINQTQGGLIPQEILHKAPSAELRPDQKDQDSLPPYEVLDAILERFIEGRQSIEEIVSCGFALETVAKVAYLVRISEFKRKQAAPGLKLSGRAFGTGWRMPIAAQSV